MKATTLQAILLSTTMALPLATSGCTSLTGQSTGQYVDDSAITASVKAKLVADKAVNLTRVDVETTNKVVSLSGIVDSADQKQRAEQLAMRVDGVQRVDNNLQILRRN